MNNEREVEVLERTVVFRGRFRIEQYVLRYGMAAGGRTPWLTYEVFDRGRTVLVVPYDPVRDQVLLLEQFRIGALAAWEPPWVSEVVAGTVELGEIPDDTARREVFEETGCEALALECFGTVLPSPGAVSESSTIYCARIDASRARKHCGLPHEGEDIVVRAAPAAEAIEQVRQGAITSGYGALPLLWFALNHERLRVQWRQAA